MTQAERIQNKKHRLFLNRWRFSHLTSIQEVEIKPHQVLSHQRSQDEDEVREYPLYHWVQVSLDYENY